MRIAVRIPDY